MPLPYDVGDKVVYTGPQLLGKPFQGTVVRLPVPHLKDGAPPQSGLKKRETNGRDTTPQFPYGPARPGGPRHVTDDRVMVLVPGDTKHPIRPVRAEHLKKIG